MKKNILITAIFIVIMVSASSAFSQSAVYFCTATGAYGFAYGYSTKADAQVKAYDACIGYGGTNPVLISSTDSKGWGAIALGNDSNGNRVIGAAIGYTSLAEAKSAAITACQNYGGSGVSIKDTFEDR
ncbi:DUF4189 domain-containing protein [bacterium]|nr:MAG: DUF4189 domain-containing protein [bacterium]